MNKLNGLTLNQAKFLLYSLHYYYAHVNYKEILNLKDDGDYNYLRNQLNDIINSLEEQNQPNQFSNGEPSYTMDDVPF